MHSIDIYGAWTIVPVIAYLASENILGHWYIFCTENTAIRLNKLLQVLDKYDVEIHKVRNSSNLSCMGKNDII